MSSPVSLDDAKKRIIVALDVPNLDRAATLLDQIAGKVGLVKVGLELFTACGPAAVKMVTDRNIGVFVDLKLHDIPATVAGAVKSAVSLKADMLTVHTGGGEAMLKNAVKFAGDTTILGVTLLTSMGNEDLAPVGLGGSSAQIVAKRASLAKKCGLGGIVCSPREIKTVRQLVGDQMAIITPGIRPAGTKMGDQKRAATPASAIGDGADYLVIGRPIRDAADPGAAADEIARQIQHALD